MEVAFTRAFGVRPGERITAAAQRAQARARSSRFRLGPGNSAWRYMNYMINLARQVRNPSTEGGPLGRWPSELELQEFYMHLQGVDWPDAEPGEYEGVNLASPIPAYVHGVEDILGEVERLSCNPLASLENECPKGVPTLLPGFRAPVTLKDYWDLGNMQRGGIDPYAVVEGEQVVVSGARMLDTAVSYHQILMGFVPPHHRCFGGYVPVPRQNGIACLDAEPGKPETENLEIFFTPIVPGKPMVYYEGTCPPAPDWLVPHVGTRMNHIRFKIETPRAYYIFLNNGRVDILSTKEYVEGPYRFGGRFQKVDGGQLVRMMNAWMAEFRGAESERLSPGFNREIGTSGFPFRHILKSQYFGAPNKAVWNGSSLVVTIPRFQLLGSSGLKRPAGTQVGENHDNRGNFITGGFYARATKLAKPVTIRLMNQGRQFHEFTLNPGTEVGGEATTAEHLHFFTQPERCLPLVFQLTSELEFTEATGELVIELSEQWRYPPEIDDIFLLLRLATGGGDEGRTGDQVSEANAIWENWRRYGCVVSGGLASSNQHLSDNKFYEICRRWLRRTTRVIRRESLVDYEVTWTAGQGSRSVLYFKRHYLGQDQFEGIAPPLRPAEKVHAGIRYVVRSPAGGPQGSVVYNNNLYPDGQVITGVAGATDYTANGADLFEYEGIVHPNGPFKPKATGLEEAGSTRDAAMPRYMGSWTNEWVMWAETKPYSYGDSSIFKPELFADHFGPFQRCHFFTPYVNATRRPNLWRHLFLGQDPIMRPEAPDGYNFVEGANSDADQAFKDSCQMYGPVPEIDSATSYLDPASGVEVVRLEFRGRFQTAQRNLFVPRDRSAWNKVALTQEQPRTMENAIMEYLLNQDGGGDKVGASYHCSIKIGDGAVNNAAYTTYSNLWGCCYPHFFMVKLPEEAPEDDFDDQQLEIDSNGMVEQMIHWELIDRAICTGFVNTETTIAICDEESSLMDFTYHELNRQAHGGRWVSTLPRTMMVNGREEGRGDMPMGFGALPRTIPSAEVFNKLAGNINLLNRARVMGPFLNLMTEYKRGVDIEPLPGEWPTGGAGCGGTGVTVIENVHFKEPGEMLSDGWQECGLSLEGWCSLNASASIYLEVQPMSLLGPDCWTDPETGVKTSYWKKVSERITTEYNFMGDDPFFLTALHPDVRELVVQNRMYITGRYSERILKYDAVDASSMEDAAKCFNEGEDAQDPWQLLPFYSEGLNPPGKKFIKTETVVVDNECRSFPMSGKLEADWAPFGDLATCIGRTSTNTLGLAQGVSLMALQEKFLSVNANSTAWLEVPLKDYKSEDW